MSQDMRREFIGRNLGIKPINHGQVYTFQIALPDSRKQALTLERRQAIEQSLLAHKSNLVSLVIRRTAAYDDDDIEYELIHGADWLQIAQELEIEKVWAWVFDLTDEQAIAAIAEMELLTQTQNTESTTTGSTSTETDLATLIDQKLQLATDSIKHSLTPLLTGIRNELDEKLKVLDYKIDSLNSGSMGSGGLENVLEKLEIIQQGLQSSRRNSKIQPIENPINLLEASDQDIERALGQIDTQPQQIKAALLAVHSCRISDQRLTWQNLERSAKAKTGSPLKVKGFAMGAYSRLCAIAIIPD